MNIELKFCEENFFESSDHHLSDNKTFSLVIFKHVLEFRLLRRSNARNEIYESSIELVIICTERCFYQDPYEKNSTSSWEKFWIWTPRRPNFLKISFTFSSIRVRCNVLEVILKARSQLKRSVFVWDFDWRSFVCSYSEENLELRNKSLTLAVSGNPERSKVWC